MDQNELQRRTRRWAEELRKAINRGEHGDVVDIITSANTSVSGGDALAVTAVLLGEMVQYIYECGISAVVRDAHPETANLLDDYRVFGRSGGFFSEIMVFIADADPAQVSQVTTTFIEMSIIAATLPSDDLRSNWSDDWAENVFGHILGRDVEGAVLATVNRGGLDHDAYMARLAQYMIELLTDLSRHEVGLATLQRVEPQASGLIDAYSDYGGNSRFLAVRFELDELGPDRFGEVLTAAASALIVMTGNANDADHPDNDGSNDDDSDAYNYDYDWEARPSLGNAAASSPQRNDVQPANRNQNQRVIRRASGQVLTWNDQQCCWVGDDGSEWVEDPRSGDGVLTDRGLWEMLNPGWTLPAYVPPKPPRPKEPDRTLRQPLSDADRHEFDRVAKITDKISRNFGTSRSSKLLRKSNEMQLAHYRRTGRWLLGTPCEPGWYSDPTGRFAFREWTDKRRWTERVQEQAGGRISIDPKFPTDADVAEYQRRLAEWRDT